jgi:hypothetical protein
MSNEPTAVIPVDNLSTLRDQLANLNKRADKLGLEPVTLRMGETVVKDHPYTKGAQYEAIEVFVEGNAPTLNGWQFVATLEHDENGTLVRRIPTFKDEIDLVQYRTASPDHCDQCHTRRRRNDTYIVAKFSEDHAINDTHSHTASVETKQVGSTCLKDFTGHESPQVIARYLEFIRDFIENLGTGFSEGHVTPRYDLLDLVTTAAAEVRCHGYVSHRKADEEGSTPTAMAVTNDFFLRLAGRTEELPEITDADADTAVAAIEWVGGLNEKALESDYLYNLFTVCKSGTLTARQFGIAASAITAYQRSEQDRIERTSSGKVDEFLGEIKDKIEITFTVERSFVNDGDYGISYTHMMRASTGHALAWMTQEELKQGHTYSGSFKVKDHRETKYGKQTRVYYPKNLQEV